MTPYRDALQATAARLRAAGIPDPAREARILLRLVLGVSEEALVREQPALTDAQRVGLDAVTRRRAAREPMAYLRGCQEFYGLGIVVNRTVLVPRPETETLVEVALQAIPPGPGVVVDVGTGSGAVALALAVHGAPTWEIVGVDVSPAALLTAALNRARLQQTRRVRLVRSDLLTAVPAPLAAVVANLPYVADADAVDPEVRHEPAEAVFAGPDGLRLIRRLIDEAAARLRPGGPLLLEVGIGQAATVRQWMEEAGYSGGGIEPDGSGVPRVVWGRWSAR